ncbi:hypothetical protein HFO68_19250 [Rhizobium laguerreae]|jgi:hypothetical protein|uniref:hypothetical protein n=1 Tax=Rhizobium laguerreae TaxID=1076926 RepID=UPI00143F90A1|nr:hypothetical protein [Rhizobium laguerreae]MBN9983608.1 hypothetical protein [Rhizobium laguerreae]MBY3048981.1 hypothetical protein [Rhizobium laguerreae]MBY3072187.1 hypothetical protein [Rhizobium laguerreae]MBY3100745.1 hypothetical protein [Rhizobium laguerreae]MBY3106677.1 hypothetical protein [Rhizobium laguerreae]
MVTLTGTSKEMEEQARKLTDAELTELAWVNDYPQALKARAELARRNDATAKNMLWWAKVAAWSGIVAVVLTGVGIAIALR